MVTFVAIASAFACEAVVGFGATLFALAIAGLVVPVPELLPVVVPLNLVLSGGLVALGRGRLRVRYLAVSVAPALGAGLPLGFALYLLRDSSWIQALFGAMVAAMAVFELVSAGHKKVGRDPRAKFGTEGDGRAGSRRVGEKVWPKLRLGALFLGGVIHGLFASGGPMVVYVAAKDGLDKEDFRSTLALLWLVVNAFVVAGYAVAGRVGRSTVAQWVLLSPALLIGLAAGNFLHGRVERRRFQAIVFAALAVAGVVIAARALS